MNNPLSVLILDDDPVVLKILMLRLKRLIPGVRIDTSEKPMALGIYEIYILDNDFHGRPLAADLAEEIKKCIPDSMIFALSGTLDAHTLKRLVNCGCEGAYDKSDPSEIDSLMEKIVQHHDERKTLKDKSHSGRKGLRETAFAISALLRDWNDRITLEKDREKLHLAVEK